MSAKCWRTAAVMSTSRSVAPRASESRSALPFVRLVVPKPGMVMARMPSRGRPSRSKARWQTSSASVESSPPDTPMTARRARMWAMRWARACAWIEKTSSQRSARACLSAGTKGMGSTGRVSSVADGSSEK